MKEYFEYDDFNYIEEKIYELTEYMRTLNSNLPSYSKTVWNLNDLPYFENVDEIEDSIKRITDYIYVPKGFVYKQWWDSNIDYLYKSFSWGDYQRWLNNLKLIQKMKEENPTLWNGISFFYWNEENKNDDWEE